VRPDGLQLFRQPGADQRIGVEHEHLQLGRGEARRLDHRDPARPCQIRCRDHAGQVGQFEEALIGDLERQPAAVAAIRVGHGEHPAAHAEYQVVAPLDVDGDAGPAVAQPLQLRRGDASGRGVGHGCSSAIRIIVGAGPDLRPPRASRAAT